MKSEFCWLWNCHFEQQSRQELLTTQVMLSMSVCRHQCFVFVVQCWLQTFPSTLTLQQPCQIHQVLCGCFTAVRLLSSVTSTGTAETWAEPTLWFWSSSSVQTDNSELMHMCSHVQGYNPRICSEALSVKIYFQTSTKIQVLCIFFILIICIGVNDSHLNGIEQKSMLVWANGLCVCVSQQLIHVNLLCLVHLLSLWLSHIINQTRILS